MEKNKDKLKSRFFDVKIQAAVACFLLSGFVIGWYGLLNHYTCIFYREQSQLFLFDCDYFLSYLRMPGGLTDYAASFLIQFFYYRLSGVLVYLCLFLCFYVVTKAMFKQFSLFSQSFFVAFIPGLLFLPVSANMLFDLSDELSLILALCGFLALTKLTKNKYYYLLIPLSVTVLYILTGGNVLLSLALYALSLLSRQPAKHFKYVAVSLLSLAIPVVIWYFFYIVSFKTACFSLTPFRYSNASLLNARCIAWFSVLFLPVAGMFLKKIKVGKIGVSIANIGLAALILVPIVKQYNPDFENILKIGLDAEHQQWEEVIHTAQKLPASPQNCYYTNLALQRTGQLAEKMFYYDQIGTSGLFLDLKDYFSYYANSELFYQLGWINPAQHSTYESMSGYTFIKEPNIRSLKRLYDCSVIHQNTTLSTKYGNILSRSLFYRDYARQNTDYPAALKMRNQLMLNIPDVLETLLEDNSTNRALFEYLMAWYMLERNYDQAKKTFDRYFPSFSYPHIPTHYAEFLLLYKRLKNLDDRFYEQYPISRELREQFDRMDSLIQKYIDKSTQKVLEDNFKHTYWFYVRFPLVQVQTTPNDEKHIY